MKIGIDAHTLGSKSSGNESYCLQLLQYLARADCGDDRYVVYFTRKHGLPKIPVAEHFKSKQIRPVNPFVRIPVSFPVEFQRESLDVFHAQYIVPPFCNCRSVVSIHDIIFERFPEFFPRFETFRSKLLVRWSARRADHVVTLSEFSKSEIVNTYGLHPEKVSVIYEAPPEEFRPIDKEKCREEIERKYGVRSPFVLYVGRLQARKNVLRLVEAFARLSAKGIAEKLVIVGRQDWRADKVSARVVELGLSDKVIFTGYADWADLPVFYNAAELFVFPSICEGFGIPVIEAMACGVPVVTSYGSSLEEVAGGAAILADPYSVDSIANAMARVLGDADLQISLREAGLKRAAEFSGRRKAAQTMEIYRKVYSQN
ncbi:MAG: glycosyltransferase family 4 protein [Candidatus Sulfotelmatobacter sp.]